MSLLDQLRTLGPSIGPSDQVAASEVVTILSALVHVVEHEDDLLKVADAGPTAVGPVLNPDYKPPDTPLVAGAPDAAQAAELAAAKDQLAKQAAQIAALEAHVGQPVDDIPDTPEDAQAEQIRKAAADAAANPATVTPVPSPLTSNVPPASDTSSYPTPNPSPPVTPSP